MAAARIDRNAAVLLVALLVVAALAFAAVSDPDLGFHLATGRAVLAQGRIPATNVLSFAEPDHPWLLQQWLPATLFEVVFQATGVAGLIALKVAVVTSTFALVLAAALALGARPIVATTALVLGAWAASFRFVERPLLFSNLALAAVGFFLVRAGVAARAGALGKTRTWLGAAGLGTAAACHLHAGAVFSFVLLGCVAVGLAVERRRRAALAVLLTAAAAFALAAGTLALYHPFGARVLLVPFRMAGDSYLAEHLIEFRALFRSPWALTKGAWLLLAVAVVLVVRRGRATPPSLGIPLVAFAALALRFVRLVDAFAIVAVPIVAQAAEALLAAMPRASARAARVARAAAGAFGLAVVLDHFALFAPRVAFESSTWPAHLLAQVARAGWRGPAFVSDGWAGPYLAAFYPRERVFFFPNFEAHSTALYREYQDIRYGLPGWDARLDRYGVELVVLKYTSATERRFQGGADNLRQRLARDDRWALVAFDDVGEVFVRRGGVNAAAAAHPVAPPGFDPDRERPAPRR